MNTQTHSLFKRGQAVLTAAIFFVFISISLIVGVSGPTLRSVSLANRQFDSKQSYVLAESLAEDVVYRIQNGLLVDENESLTLLGHSAYATITVSGDEQTITVSGDVGGAIRTIATGLTVGTGASFNYGVQTHTGGFVMENSSTIRGNLFSNGTITGSGNNLIYGDVISAGEYGHIEGVHATGTVWARNIENAYVEGDAYFQTITNTTVDGTSFSGSPDQATSTLPITDAQVEEWKTDAEAGGLITGPCPYVITGDVTLGPVKIACDLEIKNKPNIAIAGAVWVEGNITLSNTPTVLVDASLGNTSVPIIADDPSDRLEGSRITINNANEFIGNGDKSHILMLSQNNSAEQGGDTYAIEIGNSANGDLLLYAGHGEVRMNNSASLKEISAWRVRLRNSAEVIYETGLANLLFTSGPSGGYEVSSWKEVE